MEEFKRFGPGVYLIFKFMKHFICMLLLVVLFIVANMSILVKSDVDGVNSTKGLNSD